MILGNILVSLVVAVAGLLLISMVTIVGNDRMNRLRRTYRSRIRSLQWPLVGLGLLLIANSIVRGVVPEISWIIGWNITGLIYSIEGEFVGWVQSHAHPAVTVFFSFMYVYGYVFLLVFPFIAYLSLDSIRYCRELIIAYAANYGIGLVLYAMFVSYGPRNRLPDVVESLLYTTYPQFQFLTTAINTNTNVFPSLHASLSFTVALLAYRTRSDLPRWVPVSWFFTASILGATMYLGIHWAIDVVAGVILAIGAVWIATSQRVQNGAFRRITLRTTE